MKNSETDTHEQEIHVYDGIEELDNQLPSWWLGTLYLTLIFSIGYAAYYVIGNGPSQKQEFLREKHAWELNRHQNKASEPEVTETMLVAYLGDSNRKTQGKSTYDTKCSACHGPQGQGGIGPNLIDPYWLHGGKMTSIVKVISDGVPAKGMPPWNGNLKAEEIHNVAVYIKSLKGLEVSGAKAPQGELEEE